MKYQDTVLTGKQVKFKSLPVKWVEDGKIDIIVTVPLNNLLEIQAKQAFSAGLTECFKWFTKALEDKKMPTKIDIEVQMKEWGYEETP